MTALARSMQAAAARPRLAWPIVTGVVVVVGIATGVPLVLVGVLAAAGGLALFLAAFSQPRWAMLVQIALVASYGVYLLPGNVGISVTPETLVLLVGVAVMFRRLLGIERPAIPGREAVLFGVLLCAMLASIPFAEDTDAAQLEVITYLRNALFVLVMVMLLDSATWLRRAIWAFVLGVGLLACLAVVQQVTKTYDFGYYGFAAVGDDRGLKRSAAALDPNFFGQVLVSATPMALYLGLAASRGRERALAFGIAGFCGAAVWFTYSRSSLVVLAVVLLVVTLLRRINLRRLGFALILAVLVLLILPQRTAFESHFGSLVPGSQGGDTIADVSARGRLSEAFAAVEMFMDYPVLGVGAGNFPNRYQDYSQEIALDTRSEERSAHSLYLESLAEIGIVGTVAFLWLVGTALRGAWRTRQQQAGSDRLVAEGAFVGLLAFLLSSITLHLAYENYFWLVVGLALAAGRLTARVAGRAQTTDESAPSVIGSPSGSHG